MDTFAVAIVAQADGGEEDEAILWQNALLDLIVGQNACLRFYVDAGIRCQLRKILQEPCI
jgi:hypothetical protein